METITLLVRWLGNADFAGAGLATCVAGACLALILQRLGGRQEAAANPADAENAPQPIQAKGDAQEGLLVVCAWTKRIKAGDRWLTPEEFLSRQLGYKLTHGISPEGVRLAEKDADEAMAPFRSASRRLVAA